MRIVLISPRGPLYRHRTGIWKKSLRYAPLTLTTLASLVPPELDAEVVLVDEGISDIDPAIEADLVGISAITGTAPRSYELAAQFRRRGVPVVLGGVHPTLMPDEAARHADAVVVGYAEETWPELLRDFAAGRMRRRYTQGPGLEPGRPAGARGGISSRRGATCTMSTVEATRGCIHSCEFCVVPAAWGRPLAEAGAGRDRRHHPAHGALRAAPDLPRPEPDRRSAVRPGAVPGPGPAQAHLGRASPRRRWPGTTSCSTSPRGSGCRGILIGLESLNAESLAETNKAFNLRKDYRYVIRRLHQRGIALMGCFVFGFDHDTTDTFRETAEFAIEAHIDLPRFAILTPFPGTPLFERLKAEGRILTEDWSLYDGQHVVFRPRLMSPHELLRGTERAWKKTYSYRSIARRLWGARMQLPVAIPANLGYRFYAHRLHRYYTCDWALAGRPAGALA